MGRLDHLKTMTRIVRRRPTFLPERLDELQGPTSGRNILPVHLDWTPAPTYDLGNERRTRTMYATVLREASKPEYLQDHIDAATLIRLWNRLTLPETVRADWEQHFPELRAAQ